jgi:nucleoside-diphosphate-sugar epimerase
MQVLLAGATGALGGPLIRQLIEAGHQVLGIARTQAGAERVSALGATPIRVDVMDRDALLRAVDGHHAGAVIHELTALKKAPARHADMTATDALRIDGTAHLLDAARVVGAHRFITQSMIFGYGYVDHGPKPLTEDAPFGVLRGNSFDPHLAAMVSTEQQGFEADGIDGVALRYGLLYGADVDNVVSMLRKRALPVARHGGELAFIHHQDAAGATVAALEHGRGGHAYNVVDDVPATFRELISAIAQARGAPHPLIMPRWLLKVAAPYGGAVLAEVSLRVSNAKARADLGWTPTYPSYPEGLAQREPSPRGTRQT